MEFRYLGNSGFKISEITYGNWLTHGSQVENDTATQCVQAALEAGITTFDTADGYANTVAEKVLGDALKGEDRDGLEIFTKVYFPTGAKGHNDTGLSRKHIMASIDGSLERLQTDHVDLYQAHRYDYETPLEETMQAFADVVRQGKALYIGVSEWTPEQLREAHGLSRELGFQLISNQPQYSALWRVIEEEVVPTSAELGISQIVWSPIAQGVLTGKYKPGQDLPQGSRATDDKGGADMIKRYMNDDVPQPRAGAAARRRRAGPVARAARCGVGAPERQRRVRDHRGLAPRAGPRERQGVGREDPRRAPDPHRRRPRRRRGEGPVEDERELAEGAPRLIRSL
ncbi:aryl-alcohol dehydrogenase-like predicted oxidoreductase [Clavibacter michiganensis]